MNSSHATHTSTFLKTSAAAGSLLDGTTAAVAADDSSKLTQAAIGVGGSRGWYSQGDSIARNAAKHAKMIAVCDVDDLHTKEFNDDLVSPMQHCFDARA